MKKLICLMLSSISLLSTAGASQFDDSVNPQTSRSKLESQISQLKEKQQLLKQSKGKKRSKASKLNHTYLMLQSLESDLTKIVKHEAKRTQSIRDKPILQDQESYLGAMVRAYTESFLPFVDANKENMRSAHIPEILKPRTLLQIPHVDGAIEFVLLNSSSIYRNHVQEFVIELLNEIARNERAIDTKGVLSIYYFQKDMDQLRHDLSSKFLESIAHHNKAAEDIQIQRAKLTPQNMQVSQDGTFFFSSNEQMDLNVLKSFLMLQNMPALTPLSPADQKSIMDMIKNAKMIAFDMTQPVIFSYTNYQGIVQ